MADSWSTRFKETWLHSPPACHALDEKIAQVMAEHWYGPRTRATPEEVLPLRCKETAAFLTEAGKTPSNAIQCTIALALISELLLCAESGGIFRKETVAQFAGDHDNRKLNAKAMRLLRNAVCHPASADEHDGEIAIVALSDYVDTNFRDEPWGRPLRSEPGRLAGRDVAFFALRLVDNLGWWQADHWSVKLRGAKRPRTAKRT